MSKPFDELRRRVRREINARKHSPLESVGVSGAFDKFTERARRTLSLAQDEAIRLGHNYIGTEHLLLGLTRQQDAVAGRVLASLGVDLAAVRAGVVHIIGQGDHNVVGPLGLTPRAKKVMELAVDEARRLGHHYVGTEHLLLGLIREGEGIGAGVLDSFGLRLEQVRGAVIQQLQSMGGLTPRLSGPKNNVVTCRLDDRAVEALDALVEAGIRSTRSDAAAWLISAGIDAHRPLFDRVEATIAEIRRLRIEAQQIAQQVRAEGQHAAAQEASEPRDEGRPRAEPRPESDTQPDSGDEPPDKPPNVPQE
jgi:hypothetical protein